MAVLTYEFFLSILLASIRLTSTLCGDGYFSDEDGKCLRCPVHCLFCDSNEKCLSCDSGYWGSVCEIPCSKCKNGTSCEKTNEFCLEACRDGLSGILCDARCSENCSSCSRRHINDCVKCASGRYPPKECNNICSKCNNTACDEDGNCTSGCVNGNWANNCESVCSEHCLNKSCDQESGACTHGCYGPYSGNRCVSEEKTTKTLTIIVIVVIGAASIIAVVILLRICNLRARCGRFANLEKNLSGTRGTSNKQARKEDQGPARFPSENEQIDEHKEMPLLDNETNTADTDNLNKNPNGISKKLIDSAVAVYEVYNKKMNL